VSDISPQLPRVYSGETVGKRVAGWLNKDTDELSKKIWALDGDERYRRSEQKKVEEILRLYWEIQRIFLEGKAKRKGGHPFLALRHKLRRYSYYPVLNPLRRGNKLEWSPTKKKTSEMYDDSDAIFDLMELARQDLLDRLKECRCGRWIWARFSHQKFCSAKCREQEFRSSDEWKEHRRKKAREYYRLHKSGNVR
jgi:hypothetical protein